MKIKVDFLQYFIDITKEKSTDIELKEGSSVDDLIHLLIEKYGKEFEKSIFMGKKLREEIMILRNGINLTEKDFQTELKDGDEIVFTIFISGG